ncbi:MAG: hypothetical protein UU87_C0003G0074 [Parcubacteria group bacterium GW2011_GWA2_42_11]|nr:MAG: hypothetical protein UU87_C0003G0074 [Parcubacteria group bacterium GW2011_GWA2_42_11]
MKNKILLIIILLVIAGVAGVFLFGKGKGFEINKNGSKDQEAVSVSPSLPVSPISGLACANAERRPIAVMLAGDAVARPLSGLSEADLVLEMPVITGSINRLMAVFVCGDPKEIGSIRSSRHDFIPLAKGLDAIFAHWGGSHFALDELNTGVINNIDALKNPFNAFFRKSGIVSPHNGFSSMSRLLNSAQKLGYRLEGQFSGYPHLADSQNSPTATTTKTLSVNYPGVFKVKYIYDPATDLYSRWRGGTKEIDKNNGQQIAVKNVVIMRAFSKQIEGQYNDMAIEGSGKAVVYRNGAEITGTWKKDAANQGSKLYFYDAAGAEVKFMPGNIWIEVVEPSESVSWQ